MSERNRGRQEAGLGRIGRSWSRALLDVLLIVGSILIARERVAGLGLSITELLDELTEVDGRLAELESSVAAELDLRVRPGRG